MTILLTNDDGIQSDGIAAVRRVLEREHDVWTVAPDAERSGASHGITLREPVKISQIEERIFACGGTPADCVLYSLLGAIEVVPDIVVSGINHGPNIGTDIVYSGTVAAARQAALMDTPGVAVSLVGSDGPLDFELAAQFIGTNIELIRQLWLPDHILNINVPNEFTGTPRASLSHPARRIYRDRLERYTSPRGEDFFFLRGAPDEAVVEKGSDWEAVCNNRISISPVFLHPMNRSESFAYHEAAFVTPNVGAGK